MPAVMLQHAHDRNPAHIVSQQRKIKRAKNCNDAYFVDVLLADGQVRYGLMARERVCLTPADEDDAGEYDFATIDILDIRPARLLKRFFDPWNQHMRTRSNNQEFLSVVAFNTRTNHRQSLDN